MMTSNKKILLIEENHSSKIDVARILENWGCHVITSQDKYDALAKLRVEPCRLVIVSFDAPGMPCVDFVAMIKEKYPAVEILVISETVSVEDAVVVMKSGALDFILKPVDPGQLLLFAEKVFGEKAGPKKSDEENHKTVQIITHNRDMLNIIDLVDRVADSTASVLVQGESGTGKELFARYIHEKSNRSKGPFVAVNCAALPENLLESELFGHEKGAFTGAISRKPGKFELADGGTILLDEITEMQYHLQAKLLRVIQEREVDPIGGTSPVKVDVRIVATTNRDMPDVIEKGEFREDLYYRLNVIPLKIPPLRDRRDDIQLLARYFIEKFNAIDGRNVKSLTKDALDHLQSLPLKGNVREMENILQRAILLSTGDSVSVGNLFMDGELPQGGEDRDTSQQALPEDLLASPLRDVERKMIFHTLDKTGGNRTHAAKILGISVRTLRNKLNEYKEHLDSDSPLVK